VAAHEGAILVETTPGRGSTFSVLLPLLDGASPAVTAREQPASSARILVVDDEEVVRRQVRRILEVHGYAPTVVEDGHSALALLERETFDLVLLDVTMPGLDGTEVVREVRARGLGVPIVLCSGYADFPLETRLEPTMYQSFLAKPFTIDNLMIAIRRALSP
jgi:CheY-like chemotaxis protein